MEVLETKLYGCIMRRPRECHYDMLHRAHHSFRTRCIGWRSNNRTDNPISNMDTLKTGSESIEAIIHREADTVHRGICGAHGGHETTKVRLFGELMGGAGCMGGGGEKRVDGVSPGRP